jgi:hypothetical protein
MPQLKSGRHVAISASTLLEAITNGSDESKTFAIMTMRLHVHSPAQLRDHLIVGCFKDGEGDPLDPETICHHSGFNVGKVLAGKADWSQDEIDELRIWLDTNPKIEPWLQQQYDDIDAAIQNNTVWQSPLWVDD